MFSLVLVNRVGKYVGEYVICAFNFTNSPGKSKQSCKPSLVCRAKFNHIAVADNLICIQIGLYRAKVAELLPIGNLNSQTSKKHVNSSLGGDKSQIQDLGGSQIRCKRGTEF
jgi:hypothetical protein